MPRPSRGTLSNAHPRATRRVRKACYIPTSATRIVCNHDPRQPHVAPELAVENNHLSYSATRVRLVTIKPEGGISRPSQDDSPLLVLRRHVQRSALMYVA